MVVFPFAAAIGVVGYNLEKIVPKDPKSISWRESTIQRREERELEKHGFNDRFNLPKTIFEKKSND